MNDLISREQLLNEIEHNHPEYNDGQDRWMIGHEYRAMQAGCR